MRLFQVTVPTKDNSGRLMPHDSFRRFLLSTFGGYSQAAGSGAWIDEGGTTYTDPSLLYSVGVPDVSPLEPVETITREFFRCFPDQLAAFVAEIGTATIAYRPAQAAAA